MGLLEAGPQGLDFLAVLLLELLDLSGEREDDGVGGCRALVRRLTGPGLGA